MLDRLQELTKRVPRPVRQFWYTHNTWLILVLSIIGLWLFNGDRLIINYLNRSTSNHSGSDGLSKQAGYLTGTVTGSLLSNPLGMLAWIGLFWSMAAVSYRYLFRQLHEVSWQKLMLYVFLLFCLKSIIADLLTFWLQDKHQASQSLANCLAVFILLYTFWNYFRTSRKAQQTLTEQTTQAELAALKAQINPHFLFNSLNNIFGTALTEGGQRTPDGVQQLSRLMRYQLEKTQTEQVDLALEMGFLDEYVQFHRQLLPHADDLIHTFEHDEQATTIAPLLLTPLVDYALQHRQASSNVPIHSQLTVKKQFLRYQLTYPASSLPENDTLTNLEQRLTRLYPYFTLNETSANQLSTIALTINLPH